MNLVDQLNHSGFDFYFLVVDDFLDISVPELTNFISLSADKLGIKLEEKNSGRLLSHPTTLEFIKNHSAQTGHTPAIIPFKPSARIDVICKQNNWLLVSNPSSINRLLEDKIKFYRLCTDHHLPVIPSIVAPLSEQSYDQVQQQFGPKIVLQTHFGWAGNSSYVSQEFADIKNSIALGEIVKFSPFLTGYSLINNCCLTQNGLVQSPPGLQYTGFRELTNNPLATVGRQWPAFTPGDINTQIETITINFSQLLKDLHYRGFFGLDFLVSNSQVYLLECNPRLTASFALYTEIEKQARVTPSFFLHLGEFTNINYPEPTHFSQNFAGSEVVNRSAHKKYKDLKAFSQTFDPPTVAPEIMEKVL